MARKFFGYRFQIERTKKTGTIFLVFVVLLGIVSFSLYKSKSNVTKIETLSYKVGFGMNEFTDSSCDKAYRINTEKKTCGTICIKVLDMDKDYIKTIRKTMQKNGFTLTDNNTKRINGTDWEYFKTVKSTPAVSYYVSSKSNKTYTIEFIDQKSYLIKKEQENCNKVTNKMFKSIKVK